MELPYCYYARYTLYTFIVKVLFRNVKHAFILLFKGETITPFKPISNYKYLCFSIVYAISVHKSSGFQWWNRTTSWLKPIPFSAPHFTSAGTVFDIFLIHSIKYKIGTYHINRDCSFSKTFYYVFESVLLTVNMISFSPWFRGRNLIIIAERLVLNVFFKEKIR